MVVALSEDMLSFAKRLKQATSTSHDKVDHLVMQAKPFSCVANYQQFLRVQHIFHRSLAPLYRRDDLQALFPGLADLSILGALEADLEDVALTPVMDSASLAQVDDKYEAIGWLYCSEGSKIGAAFLYKETQKLQFSADMGARHLAAHPEGRGLHWRKFVSQLDDLVLSQDQEAHAMKGALDAFAFYKKTFSNVFHSS